MSENAEALARLVLDRFEPLGVSCTTHVGQVTAEVPATHLLEVARALRDDPAFAFAQLVDLCGVDYQDYGHADWKTSESASNSGFSRGVQRDGARVPDRAFEPSARFAVAYHLLSHSHNRRLRLRCYAEGEPPAVDSAVELWRGADWFEREAFDLFGIVFRGHPDLRRILTDYGFVGHPFRKDFPLSGHVEVRFDPEKSRVVYEPVSIEPRVLVPRVIRDDTRYADETPAPEGAGRDG